MTWGEGKGKNDLMIIINGIRWIRDVYNQLPEKEGLFGVRRRTVMMVGGGALLVPVAMQYYVPGMSIVETSVFLRMMGKPVFTLAGLLALVIIKPKKEQSMNLFMSSTFVLGIIQFVDLLLVVMRSRAE